MRRLSGPLVLLALAVACGPAPAPAGGAAGSWTPVSNAAFTAELAASGAAGDRVIVDVREPELFAKAHIPGAINMPWPDAKSRAPAELDSARNIVLVCHGGPMGAELAGILAGKGFRHVRNLSGGMNGWTGPTESAQ